MKICTRCHTPKRSTEYHSNRKLNGKPLITKQCKKCRSYVSSKAGESRGRGRFKTDVQSELTKLINWPAPGLIR